MNNELMHYGVPGMRWGHRKALKDLKANYKDRKNKAFAEYERTIADIEKPYKKGQSLSKKDIDREIAADRRYQDKVAKAKADYKRSKADIQDPPAVAIAKGANKVKSIVMGVGVAFAMDSMFLGGAVRKTVTAGAKAVSNMVKNNFDGGINVKGGWRYYQ